MIAQPFVGQCVWANTDSHLGWCAAVVHRLPGHSRYIEVRFIHPAAALWARQTPARWRYPPQALAPRDPHLHGRDFPPPDAHKPPLIYEYTQRGYDLPKWRPTSSARSPGGSRR